MFGLGIGEIGLILLIVLSVFGAKKLPEIGTGLGQGILNFRHSLKPPSDPDPTSAQTLPEEEHPPTRGA